MREKNAFTAGMQRRSSAAREADPSGLGFGKRWGVKDTPSLTLHLLPQFRAIETTIGVRESQAPMLLVLWDKV
jgi:hypothetical protein